jgi:cell division septation protein DedD
LLAGSYDSTVAADERLGVLERQGFQAFIVTRPAPDGKPVQVVAGKYAAREDALAAAGRLDALGIAYLLSENNDVPAGQSAESSPVPSNDRQVDKSPSSAIAASVETLSFRINAGSFSSEANAQTRLALLEQHGFAGYISWQETPAGKIFHVIAGRYATRQTANAAADNLKTLGVEYYISERQ